jgi:hypothetical protein
MLRHWQRWVGVMNSQEDARGADRWHQAPGSAGLLGIAGHPHASWVWLDDPPLGHPTPSHFRPVGHFDVCGKVPDTDKAQKPEWPGWLGR